MLSPEDQNRWESLASLAKDIDGPIAEGPVRLVVHGTIHSLGELVAEILERDSLTKDERERALGFCGMLSYRENPNADVVDLQARGESLTKFHTRIELVFPGDGYQE